MDFLLVNRWLQGCVLGTCDRHNPFSTPQSDFTDRSEPGSHCKRNWSWQLAKARAATRGYISRSYVLEVLPSISTRTPSSESLLSAQVRDLLRLSRLEGLEYCCRHYWSSVCAGASGGGSSQTIQSITHQSHTDFTPICKAGIPFSIWEAEESVDNGKSGDWSMGTC